MVGLELPVLAMEHMYLITEDMPEVAEFNAAPGRRCSHAIDFEGEIYTAAGARGHAARAPTRRPAGRGRRRRRPWDFGHELLHAGPRPHRAVAGGRLPRISRRSRSAGIKQVINGPFTFAPDGNPLVGPVQGPAQLLVRLRGDGGLQPGRRRRAGARQLDDRGRSRASTSSAMDVARFGDWATLRLHQRQGARELLPGASRSASPTRSCRRRGRSGRRRSTTSCRPRARSWGATCGLELAALVRAARARSRRGAATFRRSNAHVPWAPNVAPCGRASA